MPTALRAILALSLLTQRAALANLYGESTANHSCALVPPVLSCSPGAQPGLVDTCCVETYGGLLVSTQLWDTYTGYEAAGQILPKDAWTLHGLWPDFCNGSYTQYCDLSRQYDPAPSPNTTTGTSAGFPVPAYNGTPVDSFIAPFAKWDLLAYMKKYWVAQNQPNWYFWAHEFSKHATCYSTFDVACYGPQYVPHEDVIDFWETALAYYNTLPTWTWLSAAGIQPSNASSYSLSDLQGALIDGFGSLPYIACSGPRWNATAAGAGSSDNGYTVVTEVWYYYHIYGKAQRGQAVRLDANSTGGSVTNCAKVEGALRYYERTRGSEA